MDDDTTSAALHQLELDERRFLEEWHREYEQWINLQGSWWLWIDRDEKWQRDHS